MIEAPDNPELFEASVKAALEAGKRESETFDPPPAKEVVPEVKAEAIPEPAKAEIAPPPAKDESLGTRLKRLMDREASAREAEQKAKAERETWEKSRSEQEAELAEYRAWKAKRLDEAKRFEYDPHGYIKALNPNLDQSKVANRLWARTLGDAAPPELRQEEGRYEALKSVDELRKEVEEMRSQQAEREKLAAQEQAYYQYVGSVQAYATSNLDKHPLVKAYSDSNPEKVVQGLLKVADHHAKATNGKEILTPEQSAERLEATLNEIAKRLAPPAPKTDQPVTQTPTTLRNQHTAVQQPREVADRGEALFEFALEQARKAGAAAG